MKVPMPDLEKLRKRLQPQSALALTIEPAQIVVGLVRLGNGPTPPSISIPIAADDLVRNPEKAGKELAAALFAAGIRERRVVVCVPASWALTTSADLPEVSPEDLRGYFELRAEGEFAISDLRLAHSAYTLADGTKRATLAAVSAKRLGAVETMLGTAGCRPLSISLALEGCLANDRPRLHFLMREDHVDLVITACDGIAALRSVASPINSELPDRLELFMREIRVTLGRLPESLRKSATQARFCGDVAATLALRSQIQENLQRLGIQCVDDLAPSNPAIECACRRLRSEPDGRWSEPDWRRSEPVPFEFVAAEARRWSAMLERFNTRQGRHIALAAFALVLVPLLAFMIQAWRENSLENQWNGMKNSVAAITAQQQKIHQFRQWFEPAPHSLQIFERLIAAFPEGGEVWSKSVQIDAGSKVTCTGFARSEQARMGLLDRLRKQPGVTELKTLQVRGDNPIQFSITYKWDSRDE